MRILPRATRWRVSPVLLGTTAVAVLLSACSFDPASLIPGRPSNTAAVLQATVVAPTETSVPPSATAEPTGTAPTTATSTASSTASPSATATDTATVTATPPVAAEKVSDVLGRGRTSYAGSIPARAHNVELATSRLNGVTVPPGGVFSFNQALGPSTLDAGFKLGYGITIDNNRPRTVPSVAGGICQVATTLFHAAYWAGLEIVERNYHLYWIPKYGQPPTGVTGLDATVDDPWADLKFRNTTGNWIRIESWSDGSEIGFTIYGVDPEWTVETEGPFISNRVPASPAYVREETLSLPPGDSLEVEHAEDGFEVSMTRRVYHEGKLLDTYRFNSRYRPSRNVVLVGVRTLSAPTVEPGSATTTATPNPVVTALPALQTVEPSAEETRTPPQPTAPAPAAPAAPAAPPPATATQAPARTATPVPPVPTLPASEPSREPSMPPAREPAGPPPTLTPMQPTAPQPTQPPRAPTLPPPLPTLPPSAPPALPTLPAASN